MRPFVRRERVAGVGEGGDTQRLCLTNCWKQSKNMISKMQVPPAQPALAVLPITSAYASDYAATISPLGE